MSHRKEVEELFKAALSGEGGLDLPHVTAAASEVERAEISGWDTLAGKIHRAMARTILGAAASRVSDL